MGVCVCTYVTQVALLGYISIECKPYHTLNRIIFIQFKCDVNFVVVVEPF